MPLPKGKEGDPDEFFEKFKGYGYNDLCALPRLSKEAILSNLKKRFSGEVVYTYVGDIIISVNPFCNTGCVGRGIRKRYKGCKAPQNLPPHIYALVDGTYAALIESWSSQSILISGESGAGKTEAMKICLTYLGELSAGSSKGGGDSDDVASKLMQTNPVMEAIGNAKTVRNNNSSRFGKHFDVQFDDKGAIIGAFTSTYLLEKPRIALHMAGERNYHVFYMLCKAGEEVREPVGIGKWQEYGICNMEGTVAEVTSWNDNAEFKDMHSALLKLGFSQTQRQECYQMYSAVMAIGNIKFAEKGDTCAPTDPAQMTRCAAMLQIPDAMLSAALTTITMGGGAIETYKKPLEKHQAETARNSLLMHIYSLVFDWCVDVINGYIAVASAEACIGVLDIFGFENFKLNSFPQLCINLTNEQLHNLFIEHVFKLEQQTYVQEEVDWQFVDYEDNQHVLDTITKRPMCVFGQLDEACTNQASTDKSLLQNMHAAFDKKHKAYIKPKLNPDRTFGVHHYAGDVVYAIDGFVEKNKDALSADITAIVEEHTKWEQLKELALADKQRKEENDAPKANKKGGGGKKKKTVSRTFGESLRALHAKLNATDKRYIRCLKPNQTLKAGDWDGEFMFKQLAYSGTMEVTEIRKAGLNVRRPLKQFYMYYKICADDQKALLVGDTFTERTKLLLDQLPLDKAKYRVGKTIMFLQLPEMLDQLDELREIKALEYIINLQSLLRMVRELKEYIRKRNAAFRLQGAVKVKQIRLAYNEVRMAARFIQGWARCYLARKLLSKLITENDDLKKPLTKEQMVARLEHLLYPDQRGKEGGSRVSMGGDDEADKPTWPVFHANGCALVAFSQRGASASAGDGRRRCWVILRQGACTLYDADKGECVVQNLDMAQYLVEFDELGDCIMLYRNPEAIGWNGSVAQDIARKRGQADVLKQKGKGKEVQYKRTAPKPVAAAPAPVAVASSASLEAVMLEEEEEEEIVPGRGGCLGCAGKRAPPKRPPQRVQAFEQPPKRVSRFSASAGRNEAAGAVMAVDDDGDDDLSGLNGAAAHRASGATTNRASGAGTARKSGFRGSKAAPTAKDEALQAARAEAFVLVYLSDSKPGSKLNKPGANLSTEQMRDGARQLMSQLSLATVEAKAADAFRLCLHREEQQKIGTPAGEGESAVVMESLLWAREFVDVDFVQAPPGSAVPTRGGGGWRHLFVVLYDDGRLVRYEDSTMERVVGVVRLRHSMMEVARPHDNHDAVKAGGGTANRDLHVGDTVLASEHVLKLVEGDQIVLRSGPHMLVLSSPDARVCNDWIATLRTAQGAFLQIAPVLSQQSVSVLLPHGKRIEMRISASTRAADVVNFVLASQGIVPAKDEWALHEVWDHCGIPPGVARRRLPEGEHLLDETILAWESSLRKRFGFVAAPPPDTFRLELLKVSTLANAAPSKHERLLEFMQAMRHVREGRVPDRADVIDLCALALFVERNADEFKAILSGDHNKEDGLFHYITPTAMSGQMAARWKTARFAMLAAARTGNKPQGGPPAAAGVRPPQSPAGGVAGKNASKGGADKTDDDDDSDDSDEDQPINVITEKARRQSNLMGMRPPRSSVALNGRGTATSPVARGSVARPQRRGSVSAQVGLRGSVVAGRTQAFDTRTTTQTVEAGDQTLIRLMVLLPSAWLQTATEEQMGAWEREVVEAQTVLLRIDKEHDSKERGDLSKLREMLYAQSLTAAELNALAAMRVVTDFVRDLPGCFATEFLASLWLPPDEADLISGKPSGTEVPTLMSLSRTCIELRLPPHADEELGGLAINGGSGSGGDTHRGAPSVTMREAAASLLGELIETVYNHELISWVPLQGLLVLNGVTGGEHGRAKSRTKLHMLMAESQTAASLLHRYADELLAANILAEKHEAVRKRQDAEAEAQRKATAQVRRPKAPTAEQREAEQKLEKAKSTGRESIVMDALESTGGSGGFTSRVIRENMMDAPESSRRLRPSAAVAPAGGGDATARGKSRASSALLPRAQRQSKFSTAKGRASTAVPKPRASAAQQLRNRESDAVPKPGGLPVPQLDGWVSERQVVEDHSASPASGLGALAEEPEEPVTIPQVAGEAAVAAVAVVADAKVGVELKAAPEATVAAGAAAVEEVQTIQTI